MKSILNYLLFFTIAITISCGINQNREDAITEISTVSEEKLNINNDGVSINYKEYGKGKFTLLFVHGWCINQTYWSNQVEELSSEYRIITMDLPGFGESGKNRENWSIEEYAADINAVIDQLKLNNVILVGHSMSGDIILEAALRNENVLALIGIDNFKDVGVTMTEEEKSEIDGFLLLLANNYSMIAPAYAEGSLFHSSTDSTIKLRVMEDFKSADSTIAVASLTALFDYSPKESIQLSKLKQKLYLINSNASLTYTEGLDATHVSYEVIDIDSTGHYPMIEKPKEFNVLLKETIQKIKAERSK